jgi:formylmethanofuran dehydrogenase subunit B
MADAWIEGRPAAFEAAVAEAARLLSASRLPIIAGLGTDVAGARAAIKLAAQIDAAIDHMHAEWLLRDLDVAREAGMMVITRAEAALIADTVLLIGPGLEAAGLDAELIDRPMPGDNATRRRVIRLCPEIPARRRPDRETWVGKNRADLPGMLAALRATVAGRPCGRVREKSTIEAVAAELRRARFGVAAWSAAELDVLTIEMLCGLVDDLNRATRFSGLPLCATDQASGVLEVCGWLTGFPVRTGFRDGIPEHDPWRFSAPRLVESGEADCALWISAYSATGPDWNEEIPLIALTGADTKFRRVPHVHMAVGKPGFDHDAVEHFARTGTLTYVQAKHRSEAIPVAAVIDAVRSQLRSNGAPLC